MPAGLNGDTLLTVVAFNIQASTFNPSNWLIYVLTTLVQAIVSQMLYRVIAWTSGAARAARAIKAPPKIGQPVRW
jgi:hypothetical protein